jgi:hypothetical protein
MVKLVYMQTVFKMAREAVFMARRNGDLRQMQARAKLNRKPPRKSLAAFWKTVTACCVAI